MSILIIFKYFYFLNQAVFDLTAVFGLKWPMPNLNIILPVGISFYIFQAVGYMIDVYRGDLNAEKHFGIYALFVSFFPQLVAGPIERAAHLLPQFREIKTYNSENLKIGLKLILWGFFMKLVVADRLALYVNATYNNVEMHNGTTFLLSSILFAFQIYCDFAGYSNIAIGSAKILGFNLMDNFKRPYFAKNINDFWSRWHISLSTWFRDYVYIPLGGNRIGKQKNYRNILITFLVSGFWHGANWTFILWGALHGTYSVISKVFNIAKLKNRKLSFLNITFIILNFCVVGLFWIFFRANTMNDAFNIIYKIFTSQGIPFIGSSTTLIYGFIGLIVLFASEFVEEYYPSVFVDDSGVKTTLNIIYYAFLTLLILAIGVFDGSQFIYFQF